MKDSVELRENTNTVQLQYFSQTVPDGPQELQVQVPYSTVHPSYSTVDSMRSQSLTTGNTSSTDYVSRTTSTSILNPRKSLRKRKVKFHATRKVAIRTSSTRLRIDTENTIEHVLHENFGILRTAVQRLHGGIQDRSSDRVSHPYLLDQFFVQPDTK